MFPLTGPSALIHLQNRKLWDVFPKSTCLFLAIISVIYNVSLMSSHNSYHVQFHNFLNERIIAITQAIKQKQNSSSVNPEHRYPLHIKAPHSSRKQPERNQHSISLSILRVRIGGTRTQTLPHCSQVVNRDTSHHPWPGDWPLYFKRSS